MLGGGGTLVGVATDTDGRGGGAGTGRRLGAARAASKSSMEPLRPVPGGGAAAAGGVALSVAVESVEDCRWVPGGRGGGDGCGMFAMSPTEARRMGIERCLGKADVSTFSGSGASLI